MPMKQLHMVGVVVVIGVVLLILYSWGYFEKSSETFRYKLTIDVKVDGKLHSASSVIEATQKRANCPWWGFSGSHSGGSCLPQYTVKGVAPMIRLKDGSVIFASLSGYSSDKPPGAKGRSLARLPWLLYVPDRRAVADTTGKNWSIIPLPKETPRLEIPFAGHPLSKFRPPIWWVPPQELGPAVGTAIGVRSANAVSGRELDLTRFSIEPTLEPLVICVEKGPSWVAAYHVVGRVEVRNPTQRFNSAPPRQVSLRSTRPTSLCLLNPQMSHGGRAGFDFAAFDALDDFDDAGVEGG